MAPGYYHNPPKPFSTRVRCPVCHQEVYSRAGIHPQCAVMQSELAVKKEQAAVVTDGAAESEAAEDPALPADR
jgi:hypothetical protein